MIKLLRSYADICLTLIDCRNIQGFASPPYTIVLAIIPRKYTSYCDSGKSLQPLHSHSYTHFKISGTHPCYSEGKGGRSYATFSRRGVAPTRTAKLDNTKCFSHAKPCKKYDTLTRRTMLIDDVVNHIDACMYDSPRPPRRDDDDDDRGSGRSSLQGVLSLGNAVVLLGGALFTITGFFVSLNMRLSTVEATLRDFPLYRLETKISSLESTIQSMREDMKQRDREREERNGGK